MNKKYKGACVQVYLNEKRFALEVERAEKAIIRRVGLNLYNKKPKGFEGETIPNTKKLAKWFKFASDYWAKTEPERLRKLAEIAETEKKLAADKKSLGGST